MKIYSRSANILYICIWYIFSRSIVRGVIGYWHNNVVRLSVCLSVRPSVTLCIVAKRYILQQKCLNK